MSARPDELSSRRDLIVWAALDVLARDGIARLSMRSVATEAGVALGLAHYYFATKDALLEAMVQASRSRFIAAAEAVMPPGSGTQLLRGMLAITRDLRLLMPAWFRLLVDMDSAALRDAPVARAAAHNKAAGSADVRRYLELAHSTFEAPAALTSAEFDALAAVAMAAFDGLATRKLIDPDFDIAAVYGELERLLLTRLAPGSAPPPGAWPADPLGLRPAKGRARASTRCKR